MINRYSLVSFLLTISFLLSAQNVEFAKFYGEETSMALGIKIQIGKNDDPYIIGNYFGHLNLEDGIEIFSEKPSTFIAKYVKGGKIEWCKDANLLQPDASFISSFMDSEGNLQILLHRESGYLISALSPFGENLVTVSLPSQKELAITDFILSENTIYCCGSLSNKLYIGAYDQRGREIWHYVEKTQSTTLGKKILKDNKDNLFVAGEFVKEISNLGLFVFCISKDGNRNWYTEIDGVEDERFGDMEYMSAMENIVVSGSTKSSSFFVGNTLHPTSVENKAEHLLYLALTANGEYVWSHTAGDNSEDFHSFASSILLTKKDLIIAGTCGGNFPFNPSGIIRFNLPAIGGNDSFMMKVDENGEILSVNRVGGEADDGIKDIKLSSDESKLYFLTNFKQRMQYGISHSKLNLDITKHYPCTIEAQGKNNNCVFSEYQYINLHANVYEGEVGSPYKGCLYHQGGFRRVRYALYQGKMPMGMEITEDGLILGTPKDAGLFKVIVRGTDEIGNSSILHLEIKINGIGSDIYLPEIRDQIILLTPNPAMDEVKFNKTYFEGDVEVLISDLGGRIHYRRVFGQNDDTGINTSNLLPGMYMVNCISRSKKYSVKLIKE